MMDVFKQLSIFFICTVYVIFCYAEDDLALKKPEIYSLHIFSDIKYRFATTRVTSRVKNAHKSSSEAIFDVTLPNEAFITNLTLEIDGKIVVGEIKEKEVARKQYLAAQQRGESAAYIGTKNRETNKFSLAVTVAPQSKISFNLTYQELLKRKSSQYEQVIYIDPGQPVDDMDITVAILESREITLLRVPPLRNDIGDSLADLSTLTVISQPTPKTAIVKFVPSVDQQLAQAESGMAGQFVVQYDVERDMDAGDVLIVNGYFVHFFAPEGLKPIPYNVLFVLDVSGSMHGKKLSQLKQAMQSIIKQLVNGDMMNIMTFASTTHFWQNEMMNATDEDVIEEAFNFVNSLKTFGATNIELAIRDGLKFLNDDTLVNSTVRSPVIVFLTDGEATSGVTDKNTILRKVHRLNENSIPIFSLGFGEYADYDLVKKIALQNNGFGRKIYEASDAALQIIGFYHEIAVTLLSNITFEYLDKPVENVTKHVYANYFNGSEMVVCGQYSQSSDILNETESSMSLRISAFNGMNIVLSGGFENIIQIDDDNLTKRGDFEEITEKMWAYLTIKQLLDKKLAADETDAIERYTKEVLELSLRYGFVTPLTSMVVTMPTELNEFQIRKPGVSRPDANNRREKADRKKHIGMPMLHSRTFNMHAPGISNRSRHHPTRMVNRPPHIYLQPISRDIYYNPGESVEIPCLANGIPRPQYEWKRNGESYNPSGHDDRVVQLPNQGTIVFNRPESKDEGIFQCFASNGYGVSASLKVNLRKAKLKKFAYEPRKTHSVDAGMDLTLPCTPPQSYPPADVYWVIQDLGRSWRAINFDKRVSTDLEGRLRFTNVKRTDHQDGKAYACMAINYFMRDNAIGPEHVVEVQGTTEQKRPAHQLWTSPSDQFFVTGHLLKLKCIFAGNPTPDVNWDKLEGSFPDRASFKSFGQELQITDVQMSDAGQYQCLGLNTESSQRATMAFDVRIESAPSWTDEPKSVEASINEKATFICRAFAEPEAKYSWYINGVPLEDRANEVGVRDPRIYRNNRFFKPNENNITLTNLTLEDHMNIQCNASNKHGYVFADIYLNVLGSMDIPMENPIVKSTKKPKRKSQNKEFIFPLIINVSPPLCLKMITTRKHSNGVYLLHENSHKGIRVEMKLKRGNKKVKQSRVKEVILISNTTRATITRRTILSKTIPNLHSLWIIGSNPSVAQRHMVISTPDITLTVLILNRRELGLIVDVNANSTFSGVGVVDQLMSGNVSFIETESSEKGMEYGLFNINSKRVLFVNRQLDVYYEDILTKCWSSKKKEKQFIDMATALQVP